MIRVVGPTLASYAAQLLETDREYFELAADRFAIGGASIAMMLDYRSLPIGCVVHRVQADEVVGRPDHWIRAIEELLSSWGVPLCRIYLHGPSAELGPHLLRAGYSAKVEVGFLATPLAEAPVDVRLRRIETDADWQVKYEVHLESDTGSDGYHHPADQWVDIIRRKCATGGKQSYLIEHCGEVVGTIGSMTAENLLRVKNVYVRPKYRHSALGRGALDQLRVLAFQQGKEMAGVFGIQGAAGSRFYARSGFAPATEQVEWTKALPLATTSGLMTSADLRRRFARQGFERVRDDRSWTLGLWQSRTGPSPCPFPSSPEETP